MNWREQAACAGQNPAIFFPAHRHPKTAKRICGTCPVRSPCLAFALRTGSEDGVWGGLDQDERRRLLHDTEVRTS